MKETAFTGYFFAAVLLVLSSPWAAAVTFSALPNQVNLRVPPVGTGGSGDPNKDTTISTIVVSGYDTNLPVLYLAVNFSINHTYDSDLVITLTAPNGNQAVLANRIGGNGHNFTKTWYTSDPGSGYSSAPFTGQYVLPLNLRSRDPNGTWTLSITDVAAVDFGELLDWSMTFFSASQYPIEWSTDNVPFAATAIGNDTWLIQSDDPTIPWGHESFVGRTGLSAYKNDFSFPHGWANLWQWPNPDGTQILAPLAVVQLRNDAGEFVFAASGDGWLYKIKAADGLSAAGGYPISTKRGGCVGDSLLIGPAVQLWDQSDAWFQQAYNDDLVFVLTDAGCNQTALNRALAYFASTGTPAWQFNADQSHNMGPGRGMVLDYAHDTLYCVTDANGLENTVWALDTVSGELIWSRTLSGQTATMVRPILASDGLYVAEYAGTNLFKLNPTNGNTIWTYSLQHGYMNSDFAFDPSRNMLFLNTFLTLEGVLDLGTTASNAWSFFNDTDASPSPLPLTTPPVAAPAFGRVYVGGYDGWIYEVRMGDGHAEAAAFAGEAYSVLAADSADGGATINRLMALTPTNVTRFSLPWGYGTFEGVRPEPAPLLAFDPAPPSLTVGLPATYTFVVTNYGTTNATGVTLSSKLPDWLELVSMTNGSYSSFDHTFRAPLGTVTNGTTAMASFTAVPTRAAPITWIKVAVSGDSLPENVELQFRPGAGPNPHAPEILNMFPSGTNVVLSWTTNSAGFPLQEADDLTSGLWYQVPTPPVLLGGVKVVTNVPLAGQRFYRLRY
jgi:uncharacterized repeat protein (TIGR01451 family)